jgi:hypothetical protein
VKAAVGIANLAGSDLNRVGRTAIFPTNLGSIELLQASRVHYRPIADHVHPQKIARSH